jgi:hypothetical protein
LIALFLSVAMATEPAPTVPQEGLLAPEPAPTALRTLPPDPLQERLLGEAAEVPPGALERGTAGSEQPWIWTAIGMAAVGAGLAYAARRHLARQPRSSPDVLQIVGRASLGSSQLVLLDVAAPDGSRRRLLIGTGGSSPTLVADLGDDEPELEPAESSSSAPASAWEPEPVVAPSKKPVARSLYGQLPGLLPPPVDADERAARKRSAMALIDEVTRERRGPSRVPGSAPPRAGART